MTAGGTRILVLGSLGGQNLTQVNGACCRAGTAAAVVVGGVLHLMDCGVGAVRRLLDAGIELASLRHVFMTHHHADHNADLSALLTLAWSSGARDVTVHGPPPTARFVHHLRSLHRPTIETATALGGRRPFRTAVRSHELPMTGDVEGPGIEVFADERLAVRAKVVDHGHVPAVAFRFTTPDRDVVFSGDTGGRISLAAFARNADTLVHEVIDYPVVLAALIATQNGADERFLAHLRDDHASPEVCGRTATRARVPRLVLYHLIPGARQYPDALWRANVAPYFDGEVLVARDLLEL